MEIQKLEYGAAAKRRVDTLGITAVVCASMPLAVISIVVFAMLLRRMGVTIPSAGFGVLLIAFWIALLCGFVGLVLGVVAVVSRSRSSRMGLFAIGLVVVFFAVLQITKRWTIPL